MYKFLAVLLFVLAVQNRCDGSLHRKHHIDVAQYNASYYNPSNGVGLKAELEDSGRQPYSAKIAFRGLSCECEQFLCSCCAGINVTAIKFNRVTCTRFSYNPQEFSINMALVMNEKEIYTNTISAKNPPPLCIPFPYLPIMNFCVRFFDIYTVGKNVHACIDLETRVVGSPILILHFNCVKMGADGISWIKPEEEDPAQTNPAVQQPQVAEPEDYDDVDFEQQDLEAYSNYTSTLSPEEEAQIGQLKLRLSQKRN